MTQVRISLKKSHKLEPAQLFARFQREITSAQRLPKGLALAFFYTIHNAIETERFTLPKLSEDWENIKKKKKWDARRFIAEGYYQEAIEMFYKDGHLDVGFKKSAKHPRTKRKMANIAKELEFGKASKGLPARPLWRKTIRAFFDTIDGDIQKEVKKILLANERI